MRVLLKNANAFLPDGRTEPRNILIEDREIARVSPDDISASAQEYDLTGYTLMPGFIHAHAHMMDVYDGFNDEKLKSCLRSGFTRVRDQGILSRHTAREAVAWRERIRNFSAFPALSVCGNFISAPGGYGGLAPLCAANQAQARDAVKSQIDQGVDHIKTTLDEGCDPYTMSLGLLPFEVLSAICDEAHRHGKKVSAHLSRAARLQTLVDAGIDEAAHTCMDEIPEETLRRMVQNGVCMTPTLSVYAEITCNWGAPLVFAAMDNVRRFADMGGIIGFGNDAIERRAPWSDASLPYMEIELLKKAGLSMQKILSSMTSGGASILGDERAGRICAACAADIVGVKGDPVQFPYLLTDMRFVMREGVIVKGP